jgi:hypothetical protein
MLTIEIINDGTGDTLVGNYRYRALVNGKEIASGEVKGHYRPSGWAALVWQVGASGEQENRRREDAEMVKLCQLMEGKADD